MSPPAAVVSILHTNNMHSNVVGVGPLRDHAPLEVGGDATRGGYARLGALIAERRRELERLGPVLAIADPHDSGSPNPLAAHASLESGSTALDAAAREVRAIRL